MSDDLDAFFDEVSDVEAKAKLEDRGEGNQGTEEYEVDRPIKRQKPNVPIPRGVVVASASSVIKNEPVELSATSVLSQADDHTTFNSVSVLGHHAITADQPHLAPSACQEKPGDVKEPSSQAIKERKEQDQAAAINTTGHFTIFVGNLGAEISEADLYQHFAASYPSVHQVQIMRDAAGESKGFGFVSFTQALECARAKREMDQTWLGARPIRIKKYHGQQQSSGAGDKKNRKHQKKNKR